MDDEFGDIEHIQRAIERPDASLHVVFEIPSQLDDDGVFRFV